MTRWLIAAVAFISMLGIERAELSAQTQRLTVAPVVGYSLYGAFFDHQSTEPNPTYVAPRRTERLTVDATTSVGALIAYRFSESWRVYAEAARGGTTYRYRNLIEASNGGSELKDAQDASITMFEMGIARVFTLGRSGLTIDAGLGGAVHQIDVGEEAPICSPSTGFPCADAGHWVDTYDLRGVAASVGVSRQLASRIAVGINVGHTIGRINTENFHREFLPEYEDLEAPTSRITSVTRFSAAVSVGL